MSNSSISGVFEVHIITGPENEGKLINFVKDIQNLISRNEFTITNLINFRITCAQSLYGDFPRQPMITFYVNGNYQEVYSKAEGVVKIMEKNNIPCMRLKIESNLSNDGVPVSVCGEDQYVEFHFKVNSRNSDEWNRIADICSKRGAHLFYNPYSKSGNCIPVVTIRRYNVTLQDARNACESLLSELKESFSVISGITAEFSCYDSDVNYDRNWIFEGDRKSFMERVPAYMPVTVL